MGGIYDVSITSLCTKGAFTCVGITSSEGSKIWKPFLPSSSTKILLKNLHFTFDLGKIAAATFKDKLPLLYGSQSIS